MATLSTVEEFRRMVPGAASRMTDEQIEDLILRIERMFRGFARIAEEKRQARVRELVRRDLEALRAKRAEGAKA